MNPIAHTPITNSQKRNKIMENYSNIEKDLFDSGDCISITKYGNIWKNITNPDGTINANYGYMVYHIKDAGNLTYEPNSTLKSQWEFAKSMLIRRLTCKQAYMHFNRPQHQWTNNKDQPCTMFIQFIASKNKEGNFQLNLCGNMRSNDLIKGTPYNITYFIILLDRMIDELKEVYPNLLKGWYYHHTTSLHIYQHDVPLVKFMLDGDN
jgi:thymidylate synthase